MLMIDPAVFTSAHRDLSFHSSPNYNPTTQQHLTELLDHYSHRPCNLTSHFSTSLYAPVIPVPHQYPTTEYRRQHHRNRRAEIHQRFRSHVTIMKIAYSHPHPSQLNAKTELPWKVRQKKSRKNSQSCCSQS